MGQRGGILVLIAFLVVGAVLVTLRVRYDAAKAREPGSPGADSIASAPAPGGSAFGTAASAGPLAPRVALSFVYSSEKEEWLRDAMTDFQKAHPDIDVRLEPMGSFESVRAILANELKPVLWSPADSLAVNLLATEWKLAKGVDPVVREPSRWPRSLLLTPLVFVAWESRAKVLLGNSTELNWERLRSAVSSKKGWAGLGGDAAWAYVKLGHTDPAKSNSGLQALTLMAYDFYAKTGRLSVPDVTAAAFQDFVKALESGRRAQDFALSTTGPFMDNFIRQGPSLYDVVVVYEATAIAEMPRAVGRWEGLRVFYPSINMWSDNPACLLDAEWVTPAQRRAAEVVVAYLMSPDVQQRALRHGFRPGNLDVPVVTQDADNPFQRYRDLGVRVQVPRIADSPDGAVIRALLQTFQRNAPN